MTLSPRPDDGPQPHEWECRGCGCFNSADEDNDCWNCGFDQDGAPPPANDNDDEDYPDVTAN